MHAKIIFNNLPSKILIKFLIILISVYAFNISAFSKKMYGSGFAGDTFISGQQGRIDTLESETDPVTEPEIRGYNDTILPQEVETELEEDDEDVKKGESFILGSKVEYKARDTIRFEFANQKVFLYGDADISHEDIRLQADYIEIDFKTNELRATGLPDTAGVIRGEPVFTEKGQTYRAEEIRYNFETERGRTVNVMTEEEEGYLHGSAVKMMEDESIHVGGGKYTTCDADDPHFHLAFDKAKVLDDRIITGPAFLYIMGIPTPAVIPFGFFPNTSEQSSGIITPSYGESANRGFYLKDGGFYWGISDYLDFSLRGDVYSRGSWGLKAQTRYDLRYRFSGGFNINYAVNIDGEEGLPGYNRREDFKVVWNHNQDPRARPNSVFRANVNFGTSEYNRYDPETTDDYLSNTLQSNVSYSANWGDGRYNFSANLRHSQNTITQEIDLKLPELAFSVNRFYPFRRDGGGGDTRWYEDISMSYDMNARNEISTTDSLFLESETWRDMTNSGVRHRIPINHSFNLLEHFNISSSVNYTERWYFHSIKQEWSDEYYEVSPQGDTIHGGVVGDTIPGFHSVRDFNFSTGVGTNIYGMRGFTRGPVSAVRHVVRPNISFSYRPDFSDPTWGYYQEYSHPDYEEPVSYSIFENGVYGTPPAGQSGAINFSLDNNLEIKVRSTDDEGEKTEEKISLIDNLSISGSYDISRDSLNLSDISVRGRTRLFDDFDITYRSSWTPYAVDENNNRIDEFLWDKKGRFLQITYTSWG